MCKLSHLSREINVDVKKLTWTRLLILSRLQGSPRFAFVFIWTSKQRCVIEARRVCVEINSLHKHNCSWSMLGHEEKTNKCISGRLDEVTAGLREFPCLISVFFFSYGCLITHPQNTSKKFNSLVQLSSGAFAHLLSCRVGPNANYYICSSISRRALIGKGRYRSWLVNKNESWDGLTSFVEDVVGKNIWKNTKIYL